MKEINEKSEEMLEKAYNIFSQIDVKGENVFRMATAMSLLQEISKQINTPPEEEKQKEE